MSNPAIQTGGSARHAYISEGAWRGGRVTVTADRPCPVPGHALAVVHHTDDEGRHSCPTGFLMCDLCGGIADEPGPPSCARWEDR